jgi:hypothetical protein
VQVGDAQIAEVLDATADAVEVAAEQVGVGDVPDRVRGLEPVRAQRPFAIALAQAGRPSEVDPGDDVDEGRQHCRGVIGDGESVPQVVGPAVESGGDLNAVRIGGQRQAQALAGGRKRAGPRRIVRVDGRFLSSKTPM